jgi:two-component system, cell cycle sensor histidine kinase and response regulator CckA
MNGMQPTTDVAQDAILVVDDDATVLNLCKLILSRGGYRVLEARSGQEAIRIVQTAGQPVRLALLDVIMPGMNGIELARQLQSTNPATPVLLMSGYSVNEVRKVAGGDHPYRLIWKPFKADSLLRMVQSVMEASEHASGQF